MEMTQTQQRLSGYLSKVFGVEAMPHQLVEIEKIVKEEQTEPTVKFHPIQTNDNV